ncbi:UDP-N-acetylmuramoyl-L-alanyl-D-glutamate--2,6-diaminopimelate ligase [Serinibacter salmoneus]|uniref:UDP-N-acetylmuramyl-tripeptide synthetase n=1 Tax=Serinibacter salmoneus TaxID=556530 RepID=A0A2A9D0B6_9MICO|nr:UDP-N-acetylmuramoyl-L-alanyl-D-glutamate--2,6-diaminopimelate ligase [Serinibacter salmoneus]PFG19382.1 UDP-N-acetylmuramoylalanyl-D-glutamate--2,6-diaminopimelate ligase [Serinibacter salmoneus]
MTTTPTHPRPADLPPRALSDLADAHALVRDERSPSPQGVQVSGVTLATASAHPGDLFVAVPGLRSHGARYADQARHAGVVAIVTDQAGADLIAQDGGLAIPVLCHPEPRAIAAALAADVYREPWREMTTTGVTGTNGKTTTTFLLAEILANLGRRAGLIGTVETRVGGVAEPSRLTTPEAPDVIGMLAAMRAAGDTDLVMEVSSHAIALHRVDALPFDVVGFTHLTADHLDFHGDLESYFGVKAQLFTPAHARRGVVCVDEEWGRRLAAEATIPVVTLATLEHPDATGSDGAIDPDWRVAERSLRDQGSRFALLGPRGERIEVDLSLPGDFNVSNAALAVVLALTAGADLEAVRGAAAHLTGGVPGRMEVVGTSPRCVVDFAHNADALTRAIRTLRQTTAGRLWVVFGATGDRDPSKREEMGRTAAREADVVVVTDDDPHGEDAARIRAAVLRGARGEAESDAARAAQVLEIAPRAAAIEHAVIQAAPEDTVLIAGRGHETIQEVAGVDLDLDDRHEVRVALTRRKGPDA